MKRQENMTKMILNAKQEEGLKIALKRYIDGEKFTVISGYAGTGKSTLVKFLIEALPGINPDTDVVYATFTGKAAQVLLKKGNPNVSTLHKLLYESKPRPDGTFFRIKKHTIEYKVVVVDEVSMAPMDMIQLLFSHNVYVICLGDPFQLPPINPSDDNHLLDHPHIFLNEIMRQALDSDIIKLSMWIREGKPIQELSQKDAMVISSNDLNAGMLKWADQILVATNRTRQDINNKMRQLYNHGDKPEDGDKVICLRNYWERIADNEDPLVNGTIGFISNSYETHHLIPPYLNMGKFGQRINILSADFVSDSGANFGTLNMDENEILTGERFTNDKKLIYRISNKPLFKHLIPLEFTYAYAITCHKAQGSQWDKVLVIEESFPFKKEEHARWLYTAVTRGAEKLVLVR